MWPRTPLERRVGAHFAMGNDMIDKEQIMRFVKEIAVCILIWTAGYVIFIILLDLTGSSLMLGGAVTYMVSDSAQNKMRSTSHD